MSSLSLKIIENATKHPDKPAIIFDNTTFTYEQVNDFSSKVRNWVNIEEINVNQVAFIFLPQCPEAVLWFFGLMSAGLIPSLMPLPSIKQEKEKYWNSHQELIELTKPSLIITTSDWTILFEEITSLLDCKVFSIDVLEDMKDLQEAPVIHNDIAFLQHSSGTTGLKKGVALSHNAVAKQLQSYSDALTSTAEDVIVSWLPMYHDMGLIACTIMPLIKGQTIVMLDPFSWVSKPITLFQAIHKYRGTLVWLPNFSFEHLCRTISKNKFDDLDVSSVRAFINCSEPCKANTFDRFQEHFADIGVTASQLQVCYAMAETVYAVTQTKLGEAVKRLWVDGDKLITNKVDISEDGIGTALLSCGHTIQGCNVTISDTETHETVPEGSIGEIVISGDFLFSGYYRRQEKTNEVFNGQQYFTRDLGFVLDGHIYILGRKDDLIICNGRNYFAHEIEQYVNTLKGIKPGRNIAVGVYNDKIGSNEIYLIQENSLDESLEQADNKALVKMIRQAVQDYTGLLLRDVMLVEPSWLQKSSSGKISRHLNKDKLLNILKK